MSDLASDLSEFSLLICALREDLDCWISKALSLRAALDLDLEREKSELMIGGFVWKR